MMFLKKRKICWIPEPEQSSKCGVVSRPKIWSDLVVGSAHKQIRSPLQKSSRSSKAQARLTPRCREEDKDRLRLRVFDPTQNVPQHKLHFQHDAPFFLLLLLVHFIPFPCCPLRVWKKVAAPFIFSHASKYLKDSQSALLSQGTSLHSR